MGKKGCLLDLRNQFDVAVIHQTRKRSVILRFSFTREAENTCLVESAFTFDK